MENPAQLRSAGGLELCRSWNIVESAGTEDTCSQLTTKITWDLAQDTASSVKEANF
jgi:hypothetical protein